jgi:ornithine carbamoyltransferase
MTILEKKGHLKEIRVAYVGDGNNVANSLIEASVRTGFHLAIACPNGYEPAGTILKNALADTEDAITITNDPKQAAINADVLYTDVWVSMGQEKEAAKKVAKFTQYQLNSTLLSHAKKDAIVLHCLPAHRGEEITDEVIDGPQSAVFDQAGNRLHTQKALLEFLLT